jgi:DNA-binding transcriptional LysR family regulator
MNLHQARCLEAVGRLGSFRRAAAELGLAQPSVSHHVARLEADVGLALVARSTRGAELTPDGRVLLVRVRNLLAASDSAEAEAALLRQRRGGRVRVAAVNWALVDLVAPAAARFGAEWPQYELQVREATGDEVVRRVAEEGDDLGIFGVASAEGPELAGLAGLTVRRLKRTGLVLAAPVGHPVLDGPRLDRSTLADLPMVALHQGLAMRAALDAYLGQRSPRVVCEVGTVSALGALVAAGVGVGLVPDEAAPIDGVGRRPFDDDQVAVTRLLVEPADRQRPAAAAAFLALIESLV